MGSLARGGKAVDEAGSGRGTYRGTGKGVFEKEAPLGKGVQVWGGGEIVPVTSQGGAHVLGSDPEDIRLDSGRVSQLWQECQDEDKDGVWFHNVGVHALE